MGDVIQFVLPLAGMVVAITLLVALFQLFAIRKLLETLVKQRQMPVQRPRFEEASYQAVPTEQASDQALPTHRPATVSPPPSLAPGEQTRFEEASNQAAPASRLAIVRPPPPVEQTQFAEAPEEALPEEKASDEALPTNGPATVSPPPPAPTQPKVNRMPTLIGIVVLVLAIAFLAFVVLYTR